MKPYRSLVVTLSVTTAVTLCRPALAQDGAPDTNAPVAICAGDVGPVEADTWGGYVLRFSAAAIDDTDPNPSVSCEPPSSSLFPVGVTAVNCEAADASGNRSSCSFSVTVVDTFPPLVICPSDVGPVESDTPGGYVLRYASAAVDRCDRSPTVVCDPPSSSLFPVGVTTVTCVGTDASGNRGTGSFTVTVQDTRPPLVICPGDPGPLNASSPAGMNVSYEVAVVDASDPNPALSCQPPSDSLFPVGVTTVNCVATDAVGHSSQCSFTVTVNHTTPFEVVCPGDISGVECTSPAGTVVEYEPAIPGGAGADVVVACDPPSGSTFSLGNHLVHCEAHDASGNSVSCSFSVEVVDLTPPDLHCPGSMELDMESADGSIAAYEVSADDSCDPVVDLMCVPPSGGLFPVGVTVVECAALDDSGNGATCSFSVTVRSPTETARNLLAAIDDSSVQQNVARSMSVKVGSALASLAEGDTRSAGAHLEALVHQLEALRGKKISAEDADALIEAVGRILNTL